MAKKGSRFQRYSYEFKCQVVEDYLSGQSGGMPAIVKKYGLKSTYQINACCENFFSHLKSESLKLHIPEDKASLINQIDDYIFWYNTDRPQEKLKGMTPCEFRESYLLNN